MQKPNLKKITKTLVTVFDDFLNYEVRPYLQSLLDKAQTKTSKKIKFLQEGRTNTFTLEGKLWEECVQYEEGSRKRSVIAYSKKYPELVKFLKFTKMIFIKFDGIVIGDMSPNHNIKKKVNTSKTTFER